MSTFEENFPNGIGAIDPIWHGVIKSFCCIADEIRKLRLSFEERNQMIDEENVALDEETRLQKEEDQRRRERNDAALEQAIAAQQAALASMGIHPATFHGPDISEFLELQRRGELGIGLRTPPINVTCGRCGHPPVAHRMNSGMCSVDTCMCLEYQETNS